MCQQGDRSTPDYDFEGDSRILDGDNDGNAVVDMGADEYVIIYCNLTIETSTGGTTDPSPGVYSHPEGTEVQVEATPNSGYRFNSWSGDASGSTNPITITIDSDKSITANFSAIPPPEETGKKGGCFIATAAYDSALHPYVETLRDFRDAYLMPNKFGRSLVDLYYKYSPSVANIIAKHKPLRVIVQVNLTPFVVFSYSMVHLGPIVTGGILLLILVLPIFFMSNLRKK